MSPLSALGCLLIGCTAIQARIGETEKQCEERYGKPVRAMKDKALLGYVKPPMLLILHFTDGKCDQITYIKADEKAQDIREEI